MTTIAYHHKSGIIAVDGRMATPSMISTDNARKTFTNDVGIWIIAGAASDYKDIANLAHNDYVKVRPDCSALLIKDGAVYLVEVDRDGYCTHEIITNNQAIGSGSCFAIAAMDFGRGAVEAVEYAMTRDMFSGGTIKTYKVKGE